MKFEGIRFVGYLFLSAAAFFSVSKGFFGKKMSRYVTAADDAMIVSCIRLAFSVLFGFVLLAPELLYKGFELFKMSREILAISFLSGIANASILVLWLLIVQKGALALIEVFSLFGIIIPLSLSGIFYNEKIKLNQYVGLLLLFIAVLLMCSYNNKVKSKLGIRQIIMLIAYAISNGTADFTQKVFSNLSDGIYSISVFNLYTYISAFVVLMLFFFVTKTKEKPQNKKTVSIINKKVLIYVFLMAVCLYLTTFFKAFSAERLSAVHLYPLLMAISLIANSLMGAAFFNEKLSYKNILSVIVSFAALIIINVL